MYTIQHHWPVKTFALASSCDSEGKRTRIRRSKEERKTLVESYIKKYQSLNDGKFPSLNLTHKEVGGSFYTVREIVRDVIQENRVLGPAKFSSPEQKIDGNSAGTLGSASIKLGNDLFQLAIQVDNNENANMVFDSGDAGQYSEVEVVDAGKFFDGTQSEESNELMYSESSTSRSIGLSDQPDNTKTDSSLADDAHGSLYENLDVLHVLNANQSGIAAEQTESSASDSVEADTEFSGVAASASSKEHVNITKSLKENGQCLDHEGLKDGHSLNGNHHMVKNDEILSTDSPADVEASKESEVVAETNAGNITNPTAVVAVETFPIRHATTTIFSSDVGVDDPKASTRNSQKLGTNGVGLENNGVALDSTNPSDAAEKIRPAIASPTLDSQELKTVEKAAAAAGAIGEQKVDGVVVPPHGETLSKSTDQSLEVRRREVEEVSDGPTEQLMSKKVVVNVDTAHDALKERNPTLDRINLESWQGKKSKKSSSELEKNPLVAFLKALMDGFVQFWTE